jgi:hypothetical protein
VDQAGIPKQLPKPFKCNELHRMSQAAGERPLSTSVDKRANRLPRNDL